MSNAAASAFPTSYGDIGLSKREYFAAMAMKGILAAGLQKPNEGKDTAHWAVQNADALLAALEKAP